MPETVDPEVLADAINVIELLQSMYYGENEFAFSNEQEKELFETLQNDGSESVQRDRLLDSLQVEISLPVGTEQEPVALVITCQISLLSNTYTLSISSSSNPWLSRDDHERLTSCLKQYAVEADDRASQILETMQFIQQTTEPIAEATIQKRKEASLKTATKQDESSARFLREWIWFPMIYTREKRGHIVDWAPKYSITGFLCPGKPGALCLEGPEKNVAKFINDIKTISWSDIPASHRKMSTKWQERFECTSSAELERKRLFKDMSEVTFNLHGAFGNHNDLSMLQSWMQEKGCGDAFDHLFE